MKNLRTKEFRNSKNPYFNKKQIKTKHAKFLDSNTLWQLGQIDEQELFREDADTEGVTVKDYRHFHNERRGETFEQVKARLDLKTPERMFKDFEYWQTEIMKADLDGEHHQIEMPDVERIVELNEKKQ